MFFRMLSTVLVTVVFLAGGARGEERYLHRDAASLPDAPAGPAPLLAPEAPKAFPKDRRILTCLYLDRYDAAKAVDFMRRIGANHVWGAPTGLPEEIHRVHLINPTYRASRASEREWMYVYLATPWRRAERARLPIRLREGFWPGRFLIPSTAQLLDARVEEKESGKAFSSDDLRIDLEAGVVIIENAAPGRHYRAVFRVGDRGFNIIKHPTHHDNMSLRMNDGTVSSAKAKRFAFIRDVIEKTPEGSVIRPTSEIFDRVQCLPDPKGDGSVADYFSRVAYWQGMSPVRLAKFRQWHDRDFDPRWVVDNAYGEESFVPTSGYRQWMDLVRNDLHAYVRERNALVHELGWRVRWFYGDNFVGIEPWLGDVAHNGYDEIVVGAGGGPGLIRHITGFPGPARRIMRFTWSSAVDLENPNRLIHRFTNKWLEIKREALFRCMDGFTLGGLSSELAGTPVEPTILRIIDEFKEMYALVHDRQVYTHKDFKIYVVTAWGKMRSWWWLATCFSQHRLHGQLANLPLNVKWIGFGDILEDGVPTDASALIVNGEPDTAYGGGRYWRNAELVRAFESYVRGGGGLLVMGAPTLVDGRFALSDMLGLDYAAPPNEECRANLWNRTRWSMAGRNTSDYPVLHVFAPVEFHLEPGMPGALGEHLGDLETPDWVFRCPALVKPASAKVLALSDSGDNGVFLNDFGKGRVACVTGFANSRGYGLVKTLIYHVAGRMDDLGRLTANSDYVSVYLYPEAKLLIAFCDSNVPRTSRIRFDPSLADIRGDATLALTPTDPNAPAITLTAAEAKSGFEVALDPGQTIYWRIGRAGASE